MALITVKINTETLESNNAELLLLEIKDYLDSNEASVINQMLVDIENIKDFLIID